MSQARRTQPLPRNWALIRRRILRRDGYACCVCGAKANHVDHIIPAVEHGSDDDSNLQSLCSRHHAEKTSAEANRHNPMAIPRKRQEERHPGLL
jgi:5-methylcytosine-specific restriction enzyme A